MHNSFRKEKLSKSNTNIVKMHNSFRQEKLSKSNTNIVKLDLNKPILCN